MKLTFTILLLAIFTFTQAQQKHTVYFDFDIDEANSSSIAGFDNWLKENKNAVILKVVGCADSVGSIPYNRNLSLRRVKDVVNRLQKNKIAFAEDFEIQALGEEFEQDKEQAKNRKVEVYYGLPVVTEVIEKTESDFAKKVKQSKVGDKLKLPELYFYNYSDIVVPWSRPVLDDLFIIMRDNPKLKIDIQGHICCETVETGDISRLRARAVYGYLVRSGIDKSRLSYQGLKSSHPVYPLPEKNEDERNANRRVEIEIIEN
ncbi:OmpA family protein [Flavobacterium alkalisoli]|uniref:OmpA family protein n=1 Tax=Flavobacterium alkalisoli TaxID=2602769 RepID=UPI003A918324